MTYLFRGLGYCVAAILFSIGLLKPETLTADEAGKFEMPQLSSIPDVPQPFGFKSTWLAVRTENTKAVFDAMGLSRETISNWDTGIKFSYNRDIPKTLIPVFVTPSVNGWVFVLTGLGIGSDSAENTAKLEALLSQLSQQFGEAQYFGSYRVVGYVAWYRAIDGEITRGFSFADGTLFANVGQTLQSEIDAGLFDMTEMNEEALWEAMLKAEEESQIYYFNEEQPMKIAERWSVNPLYLKDIDGLGSATGLAGVLEK